MHAKCTMTIVRSKQQLEFGFLHFIEVVPILKSGQDFDVGFGNDSVGSYVGSGYLMLMASQRMGYIAMGKGKVIFAWGMERR